MTSTSGPARRLALLVPAVLLVLAGCGGDGDASDSSDGGDSSETPSETPSATADETASGPADETASGPADESAPTDAGDAPTKEEFVEQANAICAEGNTALAESAAGLDGEDPEAVADYARSVLVPNVLGQLQAIKALGFPPGDEQVLAGILADAGVALQGILTDPSSLTLSPGPFASVNEELAAYGLTECATG